MAGLPTSSRSILQEKVERYAEAYPGSRAQEYMEARGIGSQPAATFRLGYVDPEVVTPDDSRFAGFLSIPYMTPVGGAVAVKYRNLRPDAEPRYLAPTGQEVRLFNVMDLHKPSPCVVLCEGEIDAMTVSMLGVPAVGLPGTQTWRSFYSRVFDGYREIVVLTDNDAKPDGSNPGQDLARLIMREMPGARNVVLPDGYDANSFYLSEGGDALLDLLGVSPISAA